jgi:hypothetical protein
LPHARLYQQSPHKVPSPQTSHSPTYSLQGDTNPIWHKSSGGGQQHTTTHPRRDQTCSTSCTMNKQLTQHFLPLSVPFNDDKPTAHGQWLMHVTNSSITLPHTQMQVFDTKLATWHCQYIRTCPTCPNQVVKVEWQVISTYPIAMINTSTMVPYSPCRPSSNT